MFYILQKEYGARCVYFYLKGPNFEKRVLLIPYAPNFSIDESSIKTGINYFPSKILERLND